MFYPTRPPHRRNGDVARSPLDEPGTCACLDDDGYCHAPGVHLAAIDGRVFAVCETHRPRVARCGHLTWITP